MGHNLLVASTPRIHSNVSVPTFDEKKAAYWGHLFTEPFDIPCVVYGYPKQNRDNIASKQKMITHFPI
jgi:hypothetical protein